jgi:hypothetical protein
MNDNIEFKLKNDVVTSKEIENNGEMYTVSEIPVPLAPSVYPMLPDKNGHYKLYMKGFKRHLSISLDLNMEDYESFSDKHVVRAENSKIGLDQLKYVHVPFGVSIARNDIPLKTQKSTEISKMDKRKRTREEGGDRRKKK